MKTELPPFVTRGPFRHRHDCPTTHRTCHELPRMWDKEPTFADAVAEFSRTHTCDCPGVALENEAQDDLGRIVGEAVALEPVKV